MSEEKIKVLLIEDSSLMRLIIADIIRSDGTLEIVDTAKNGKEGVEKTATHKPDVIVTDLIMPDYDGVYAVKNIMQELPTPIVVLSSLEKADPLVFDALAEGAVDFVDKPKDKVVANIREVNFPLIQAIKAAKKANVRKAVTGRKAINFVHTFDTNLQYECICIGASTGGPGAVEKIIEKLPANLSVPVIIAQHMPEKFLESFANRLNALSPLTIKLADKGEVLCGGVVYIAPGHSNMKIIRDILTNKPIVTFTKREFKEFNFPSVDCLMQSVAETFKNKAIGVILTGMGKDGAEGMRNIFEKGGYTIAQDESTSVVFGMPKAVIDMGVAKKTVPLHDIASFMIGCL